MPLDSTSWETKTDETTEILIRARSLLERGWCRNTLAIDQFGIGICNPTDTNAVGWCAIGALYSVTGTSPIRNAVMRLEDIVGGSIVEFNNAQKTVEPVLAVFDQAIAESLSNHR